MCKQVLRQCTSCDWCTCSHLCVHSVHALGCSPPHTCSAVVAAGQLNCQRLDLPEGCVSEVSAHQEPLPGVHQRGSPISPQGRFHNSGGQVRERAGLRAHASRQDRLQMHVTPSSVKNTSSFTVVSMLPPASVAKSTVTEPDFMTSIMSLVKRRGASLPGMRAVEIVMSTSSACILKSAICIRAVVDISQPFECSKMEAERYPRNKKKHDS